MARIGYARVSTIDQDLEIQLAALRAAGCDPIRAEKRSGTSTVQREELAAILAFIRPGDELIVTRVDRLARSIGDLQDIVRELRAKGATLKATEQPIDTASAAGKAFLDMLGVFAEFETNLRKERQLEGIAAAKVRGVYKGRPATIDGDKIEELKGEGLGATEIAKRLGVGRASVYRLLEDRAEAAKLRAVVTEVLKGKPAKIRRMVEEIAERETESPRDVRDNLQARWDALAAAGYGAELTATLAAQRGQTTI